MIVIGGGVIGLMTGWRLADAGLNVILLERGRCGQEASWAGAGLLDPGAPSNTSPIAELRRASLALYPDFAARLQSLTGIDVEYNRCGSLDLVMAESQRRLVMQAAERESEHAASSSTTTVPRWLSQPEIAAVEPAVTHRVLGAMLKPDVGQVRSTRLTAALFKTCGQAGVRIVEHADVNELVAADSPSTETTRVCGVRTSTGLYRARHVVLAAGAWTAGIGVAQSGAQAPQNPLQVGSRRGQPPPVRVATNPLAARVAGMLPVYPVRGQIVLYRLPSPPIQHVIEVGSRYLIARNDGHVLVGSTREHDAGFDKSTTATAIAGLRTFAQEILPCLSESEVVRSWAGLRPGTPDGRPYIGFMPGLDGLIAATGHYMSGIILAPVTAEIVTECILHGVSRRDLRPFAPGRNIDSAGQDD